jgi:hypothetical protein
MHASGFFIMFAYGSQAESLTLTPVNYASILIFINNQRPLSPTPKKEKQAHDNRPPSEESP